MSQRAREERVAGVEEGRNTQKVSGERIQKDMNPADGGHLGATVEGAYHGPPYLIPSSFTCLCYSDCPK